MKKLALLVLLFSFNLHAANDPVIAEVNGIKIHKSEFDKIYHQNKLFVSNKVVTKEKVLGDMIARIVGVQKAKKAKLDKNPVVVEKLEDILYHAQISKDLEPELAKIRVSDEDVKSFYQKNQEYRTAQILLRVKAEPKPEDLTKISIVAQDIYKKVAASPDKFGEFANRYSQAGNAKTGGDLGFQVVNRYPPQVARTIQGKKPGDITRPIRSQYGYHIMKILAIKDFKDINMGIYKKMVYQAKRDNILQNYFKRLRSSAKVKIYKEKLK